MGTRTGEELLEAMRERQLFIDGDRVEDVPPIRALAQRRGASLSSTTCSTTRRSSSG